MLLVTDIFCWKDPKSRSFNYLPTGISRTVRKSKLFPTFLSQKNGVDDKKKLLVKCVSFHIGFLYAPHSLKERMRVEDREKMALVPFYVRTRPKIPFLGLSLLRKQTETLATQAMFDSISEK